MFGHTGLPENILNGKGERLMKKYAPDRMELAPRDVTARAIQTEIDEGGGIGGGAYVHLDLRHLGAEKIMKRLPQILDLARRFRITMKELGVVGGEHVDIEGLARVGAAELRTAWSEGFAAALGLEG